MTPPYRYDAFSDVLDVHFITPPQPARTIELTPNIMVSLDQTRTTIVGLTFLDYSLLSQPTPWGGQRSFPVTGLANMPLEEQTKLFQALHSPAIQSWLHISVVENLPDSPFTITHLHPPPLELLPQLPTLELLPA